MNASSKDWFNYNFGSQGMAGFGTADVNYLRSQGYTPQQMYILGQSAQAQGLNINPAAQAAMSGGGNTEWAYTQYGGPRFGGQDLQAVLGQGGSYDDVKRYSDYANQSKIGTADAVTNWLDNNKDNYAYMSANQQREIQKQDQLDTEARAQAQWEKNLQTQKEMNPRITAQNQRMQAGSAGGVATQRSEDFRREGGTRSTKQASRGMFIESLNI